MPGSGDDFAVAAPSVATAAGGGGPGRTSDSDASATKASCWLFGARNEGKVCEQSTERRVETASHTHSKPSPSA
eukprot:CAMPEP_0174835908 /NCGR_PEP_ID=MMETSP1114-20130205/5694_1 /TAXON_ID=312471 /ORGANISM="Neobodo designis, Strain CCAP 1951/1" /LENGTH=73 /DNA_ID=CAMNT_0016069867 /DNA_START=14 /DNA_END=231 /DNA_ORIENTATION=+